MNNKLQEKFALVQQMKKVLHACSLLLRPPLLWCCPNRTPPTDMFLISPYRACCYLLFLLTTYNPLVPYVTLRKKNSRRRRGPRTTVPSTSLPSPESTYLNQQPQDQEQQQEDQDSLWHDRTVGMVLQEDDLGSRKYPPQDQRDPLVPLGPPP